MIGINSASYPAWAYRWQCLEALFTIEELKKERAFLDRVAAVNVKNYQLWNHRRRLAFRLGPNSAQQVTATTEVQPSQLPRYQYSSMTAAAIFRNPVQELEFAGHCLEDDPKNYHTWAHRQAVVERFALWEQELDYTAHMIRADVRNNSAWNQRFYIVSKSAL